MPYFPRFEEGAFEQQQRQRHNGRCEAPFRILDDTHLELFDYLKDCSAVILGHMHLEPQLLGRWGGNGWRGLLGILLC